MMGFFPMVFMKMSGAGNTFALVDAREGSAWQQVESQLGLTRAGFAKKICSPVTGVGADGMLYIQSGSTGFDYDWDFYNSDGSKAEMCGNAARCAARYCAEILSPSSTKTIRFKTGAGLVVTDANSDGRVIVRMPEARLLQKNVELKTKSSSTERFSLINTGVPHLVQKIHDMRDAISLKEMAREVRFHESLMPAGANVTFYSENSPGVIDAITYERGVEEYTLACGTGAVAAAYVYASDMSSSKVEVRMPGGLLEVAFSQQDPHPLMTGDAVFIGEFKYNLEVLK